MHFGSRQILDARPRLNFLHFHAVFGGRRPKEILDLSHRETNTRVERSQNTVLLASTQAVYKSTAQYSVRRDTRQIAVGQLTQHSSSSKKSQSIRLEHSTVEPVAASCTYASAINASKISSVFIVYRRKTLTGSPDPTHANGLDKPCIIGGESSL